MRHRKRIKELEERVRKSDAEIALLERRDGQLVRRLTEMEDTADAEVTRLTETRDEALLYVRRMKEQIKDWSGDLADEPIEYRFARMLYDVLMFKARFPDFNGSVERSWIDELRKGLQGARHREGWTSGKLRETVIGLEAERDALGEKVESLSATLLESSEVARDFFHATICRTDFSHHEGCVQMTAAIDAAKERERLAQESDA